MIGLASGPIRSSLPETASPGSHVTGRAGPSSPCRTPPGTSAGRPSMGQRICDRRRLDRDRCAPHQGLDLLRRAELERGRGAARRVRRAGPRRLWERARRVGSQILTPAETATLPRRHLLRRLRPQPRRARSPPNRPQSRPRPRRRLRPRPGLPHARANSTPNRRSGDLVDLTRRVPLVPGNALPSRQSVALEWSRRSSILWSPSPRSRTAFWVLLRRRKLCVSGEAGLAVDLR